MLGFSPISSAPISAFLFIQNRNVAAASGISSARRHRRVYTEKEIEQEYFERFGYRNEKERIAAFKKNIQDTLSPPVISEPIEISQTIKKAIKQEKRIDPEILNYDDLEIILLMAA